MKNRETRQNLILTLGLCALSVVFVLPLYFTAVFATRSLADVFQFPPPLWFGDQLAENYGPHPGGLSALPPHPEQPGRRPAKTLGLVLVSAFAGYGLARYASVPSHKMALGLAFATLFFPPSLALIPFFLQMGALGWLNSFLPLILPAIASGFGVIWMFTYIGTTIPPELYEAAEMDNSGPIATFVLIVLPIIRPGLAALSVWTVISTWNDFQLPLVILGDGTKFTVPLALTMLNQTHYSDTPAVMLATLMGLVPLFVLFAFLSRQFIAGLTSGAVK